MNWRYRPVSPVFLSIVLQDSLQLLPCKEYAALYRSKRQFQPFGYLAVLEPRYVH